MYLFLEGTGCTETKFYYADQREITTDNLIKIEQ